MIFLNIMGVLILYIVWKVEKELVRDGRDRDNVTAFLIPCLMAASICWVIFDLIFMILG